MEDKSQTIKKIGAQVEDTYKRAFFDLLKERTASNPPDYEWLTRLYGEIRAKLTKLLKRDSQLRKEIESSMDCDLFRQMISNNAFNPEDFYKLIRYVFEKCKQLGSPARDSETDAKLQEIISFVDSGKATFATLVPLFIKNANECLDLIYEDIRKFSEFLQSAGGASPE